jgi:Flp pilus assembly pilin Flp
MYSKQNKKRCIKFLRNEEGLESVEFAVMTAMIVSAMVVALGFLGVAISDRFVDTAAVVG